MRKCLLTLTMAATLIGLAAHLHAADLQPPSTAPQSAPAFKLEPYLQNLQPDGVWIYFQTTTNSHCWVEFGQTEALGSRAEGTRHGLKSANTTLFAVPLLNLKPGTRYFYQVKGREILEFHPYRPKFGESFASATNSFATIDPAAKSVKAIIFNDLHNQPAPLASLLKLPQAAGFDFSLFNGDCLADLPGAARATPILAKYLAAVDGASRPAILVRGNHEIRGGLAREIGSFFGLPAGEFYFAFTRGDVRFVAIDCGEDKPDSSPEYSGLNDFEPYRKAVAAWLATEVRSPEFKTARWHVLVHHIPLYGHGASPFGRPLYNPIIEQAPFDVAINGHTHTVALLPAGEAGNPFPVVVGGGPGERATMIVLEAKPELLSIQTLDAAGKVLKQWESRQPRRPVNP